MSYTNIKKHARQAWVDAMTASDTGFSDDFRSIQIIQEFSHVKKVQSRRILVGASAAPSLVGATQIGWIVELVIQAQSDFFKHDSTTHENILSPIEALIFTSDLATRLTNATFITQVATPLESPPDDFQDNMRITEYRLQLDCLLTGV